MDCKVKFDVADVAYPVVSLGKMIESAFTFSFDDYKCYMHKGNQRVEIFRKGHYHREAPQPMDGDVARIQMDFMFVGAEGTFVDEPRARATVLMVICKDDGNLSATEVRSKTDEYGVEMVLRFLSTYESVEIKTDGEPSTVEIARRVQARRDKTTTLAQTSVGGHQEIGAVERANGTVQAQLRAYYLDVQDRMKVRIIPGTQLFPWLLRHSVWTVVRYQSDQRTKQTPYERTRGC